MCWSAERLATKLGDYLSEPASAGHQPAQQAATVWKELQRGATRSLLSHRKRRYETYLSSLSHSRAHRACALPPHHSPLHPK